MKKNMLTVLILALLIVNLVLTSVLMVSVMGTNQKTSELVNNIATVMRLELKTERGRRFLWRTPVYNLTTMTIPLNSGGGVQRYIQFDAALSMNIKRWIQNLWRDHSGPGEPVKDAIPRGFSPHRERVQGGSGGTEGRNPAGGSKPVPV